MLNTGQSAATNTWDLTSLLLGNNILKTYLLKYVARVIVLADEFAPSEPIPLKFEQFERFASSVDGAS